MIRLSPSMLEKRSNLEFKDLNRRFVLATNIERNYAQYMVSFIVKLIWFIWLTYTIFSSMKLFHHFIFDNFNII